MLGPDLTSLGDANREFEDLAKLGDIAALVAEGQQGVACALGDDRRVRSLSLHELFGPGENVLESLTEGWYLDDLVEALGEILCQSVALIPFGGFACSDDEAGVRECVWIRSPPDIGGYQVLCLWLEVIGSAQDDGAAVGDMNDEARALDGMQSSADVLAENQL